MSTATPAGTAAGPAASPDDERVFCTLCGAPMDRDQEWCMECGAARTIIRSAPDWRIPLLLIGAIVIAAVVAFVVVLSNLGTTSTVTPSSQTAAAAKPAASRSSTLASWPPGLDGWTVILATDPTAGAAQAQATKLAGAGVKGIGVLDTTQHPHMHPGSYDVFAQRYPTQIAAQAAATQLVKHGQPQAAAHEVAPPGGV